MLLVMVIFQALIKLILQQIPLQEYSSADSPASPSGRVRMGSAHSSSASYFAGGRPKDQGNYSTVEKLTYTSETVFTAFWIKFI